jgi:hypothetical protein
LKKSPGHFRTLQSRAERSEEIPGRPSRRASKAGEHDEVDKRAGEHIDIDRTDPPKQVNMMRSIKIAG